MSLSDVSERETSYDEESDDKEEVSLYDAVAGRVGHDGFLSPGSSPTYRDTTRKSAVALPPVEVLFQEDGAPTRYAEDDVYWAERYLDPTQQLPDSDLLKAIHRYASDFYASATETGGTHDYRSLDETALLALGILIEEAAYEGLGETGDLALTEAESHQQCDDTGVVEKEEILDDVTPKIERSAPPVIKTEPTEPMTPPQSASLRLTA